MFHQGKFLNQFSLDYSNDLEMQSLTHINSAQQENVPAERAPSTPAPTSELAIPSAHVVPAVPASVLVSLTILASV